jgi:hypothetical protein
MLVARKYFDDCPGAFRDLEIGDVVASVLMGRSEDAITGLEPN